MPVLPYYGGTMGIETGRGMGGGRGGSGGATATMSRGATISGTERGFSSGISAGKFSGGERKSIFSTPKTQTSPSIARQFESRGIKPLAVIGSKPEGKPSLKSFRDLPHHTLSQQISVDKHMPGTEKFALNRNQALWENKNQTTKPNSKEPSVQVKVSKTETGKQMFDLKPLSQKENSFATQQNFRQETEADSVQKQSRDKHITSLQSSPEQVLKNAEKRFAVKNIFPTQEKPISVRKISGQGEKAPDLRKTNVNRTGPSRAKPVVRTEISPARQQIESFTLKPSSQAEAKAIQRLNEKPAQATGRLSTTAERLKTHVNMMQKTGTKTETQTLPQLFEAVRAQAKSRTETIPTVSPVYKTKTEAFPAIQPQPETIPQIKIDLLPKTKTRELPNVSPTEKTKAQQQTFTQKAEAQNLEQGAKVVSILKALGVPQEKAETYVASQIATTQKTEAQTLPGTSLATQTVAKTNAKTETAPTTRTATAQKTESAVSPLAKTAAVPKAETKTNAESSPTVETSTQTSPATEVSPASQTVTEQTIKQKTILNSLTEEQISEILKKEEEKKEEEKQKRERQQFKIVVEHDTPTDQNRRERFSTIFRELFRKSGGQPINGTMIAEASAEDPQSDKIRSDIVRGDPNPYRSDGSYSNIVRNFGAIKEIKPNDVESLINKLIEENHAVRINTDVITTEAQPDEVEKVLRDDRIRKDMLKAE